MAKIVGYRLVSFETEEVERKGFAELIGISSKVHSVSDRQYVISAAECEYLTERGIKYNIEKKF